MKRNYPKLIEEYRKKFNGVGDRELIYSSDYCSVRDMINEIGGSYNHRLYKTIGIALRAGIMIGYKVGRTEEKKKSQAVRQH